MNPITQTRPSTLMAQFMRPNHHNYNGFVVTHSSVTCHKSHAVGAAHRLDADTRAMADALRDIYSEVGPAYLALALEEEI